MTKKIAGNRISLYPHKCTGCRACEMICSVVHHKKIDPNLSRIKVLSNNTEGFIEITVHSDCSSCENPKCSLFCKTGALSIKRTEYKSLSV